MLMLYYYFTSAFWKESLTISLGVVASSAGDPPLVPQSTLLSGGSNAFQLLSFSRLYHLTWQIPILFRNQCSRKTGVLHLKAMTKLQRKINPRTENLKSRS